MLEEQKQMTLPSSAIRVNEVKISEGMNQVKQINNYDTSVPYPTAIQS